MLGSTVHIDTFTRDNLPPQTLWPTFLLEGNEYPEYINAAVELTDKMVEQGYGDKLALIGDNYQFTYKKLTELTNQIAQSLIEDYGVMPGNRILIRSANSPMMVACWLAATKAGAVVINTDPMLRSLELSKVVNKAEVYFSLCEKRLLNEIENCQKESQFLKTIIPFDGSAENVGELNQAAETKSVNFQAVLTGRDDVALLGFTSGSTGEPKATMHFHRDILAIADHYAKNTLKINSKDIILGASPLAFTFGLGGLAIFPLRFGATSILMGPLTPIQFLEYIEKYKVTICFTVPTAYKVMIDEIKDPNVLASLRVAVSAGETLHGVLYDAWINKTQIPILDGIGCTEMLHIFISNSIDNHRRASTGRVLDGYQVKIVDNNMDEVPYGEPGWLAVKGPTGCRYLADERQKNYVRQGWNITGDIFKQDEDGFFYFSDRSDGIIVSSGYNISGTELESVLLTHPAVKECVVIGVPDEARGKIASAFIVLNDWITPEDSLVKELQDYVKSKIAPYKYPRAVKFVDELPKTSTGKLQRFKLLE